MDYNTFVMLGKPGAGKGKQSALLAEATGYSVFSTGGRFREIRDSGTFMGQKIDKVLKTGDLMPSWFAVYLFQEAVLNREPNEGVIYEGAGRMRPEAEIFHEVMTWLERPYRAVHINLPDDVALNRLLKRASVEGRKDDKEEVIRHRLDIYRQEVIPSVEFFREKGTLIEVNGDQTPEAVHAELIATLKG